MSDDEVGPAIPAGFEPHLGEKRVADDSTRADVQKQVSRKKQKMLEFEALYLGRIPSAELYETSYMHRDDLTLLVVTKTDFIITASKDGILKFWKKLNKGIEFVKVFKAHVGPVTMLTVSHDGMLLCSGSNSDKVLKIFDVINFGILHLF